MASGRPKRQAADGETGEKLFFNSLRLDLFDACTPCNT